jgi:hypothetical protein
MIYLIVGIVEIRARNKEKGINFSLTLQVVPGVYSKGDATEEEIIFFCSVFRTKIIH